jgi:RNA-directed DNA polymerase
MRFPREEFEKQALLEGHSEIFIRETLKYADFLDSKNMPVIFSTAHFAKELDISYSAMLGFIKSTQQKYKHYKIKKRKGGFRWISSPYSILKKIQNWIKSNILDKITIHACATAYCLNKSIKNNAEIHLNQDFILNLDLFKFFDCITEHRIYGVYKNLGYHKNLAVDMAKLSTTFLPQEYFDELSFDEKELLKDISKEAVLPQGAPTSPILSNAVAYLLDVRLSQYANKNGFKYSRYADDITISGKTDNLKNLKLSLISKIIKDEGFHINWNKVRFYNKELNKKIVTGLIVDKEVRICKKYKKEIFRHLFFIKKFGIEAHLNRLHKNKKFFFKDWLYGKISFVNAIEPNIAKKMLIIFNSISW